MANLADLTIGVGVDDEVTSGLGEIESKVDRFAAKMDSVGASMQSAGLKMSAFVTAPLVAGMSKATDAASDLNESVNAVNVMFGDAADGVLELGRNAAESAGLSRVEFNGLAVQMSSFASTVAGAGGDVVGTLDDLTGRAADFASVMNLDVADAARIFQSGLAGETEPLRKFGIDLSAAAVQAHAVEAGIAAASDEMTEQQKVQARYSLLMAQTAKTAGDFAATADEAANAQRRAAARAENLAATFGEKLLPVKAKALELAGSLLDRFESMSPSMQTAAVAVAGVAAAIGPLVLVAGTLIRSFGEVATATSKVIGWFAAKSTAATTSAATEVAANNATKTSMLSTVAAKTAALGRWVAATVASSARAVATMAVTSAQFLAHYARMAAASMVNAVKMAASWVVAMGPVGWVIAAVVGLVALIIANWEKVKQWTAAAWEWVSQKVASVWNWIKSATSSAVAAVVGMVTGLRDAVVERIQALVDRIIGIKDTILGFFAGAGSWLLDAGRNIVQGIIDGIMSMVSKVGDAIGSVTSKVRSFLPFSPAKEGPLSGRGAPDIAGAKIGRMLADGMRSQVSAVAAAGSKLAAAAVPGAGRVQVPTVRAAGGAGGATAGGVSISVTGTMLDPEGVARAVERALHDAQRRTGGRQVLA